MNTSSVLIVAVIATLIAVPAGVVAFTDILDDGGSDADWNIYPTQGLVFNGNSQTLVGYSSGSATILFSTDGVSYSDVVPQGTDAQKYAIWYKVVKDGEVIEEKALVNTIEKKTVTITVNDCSKMYGEADPTFTSTSTGTVGSDSVSYTLKRDAGEDFGSYAIRVVGELDQGNYHLETENGYLIIYNQIVTVVPNDASKMFGASDPVFTATVEGDANVKYTLTRDKGESPGAYKIHATGERLQGNYLVEFETGIFTIKDNSSGETTPKDNSNTEAIPGLIYNGTPQQLVRSTVTDETVSYSLDGRNYSTTVPTATDAGEYTVWYKVVKSGKTLTEKSITAYIEPKSITVKAVDCTKLVGDADPQLTAEVNDAADADKIKYTLSREQGETLGSYTINVVGNEIQGNYRLVAMNGQLTIYQVVKVEPNDASKAYGTSDPVFTATVDPSASVNYTLVRETGEDLGAYKIRATGETIQGYYIVEFDSGIFMILETAASWESEPISVEYTFDGYQKNLVVPGVVSEGTAYYRLDTGNYSTAIPKASEPGVYKIYCKVSGGGELADSTEIVLTSVINEYIWNGTETKEPLKENGVYMVYLPSELAWISQNNSSKNGFSGSSFAIMHDMNLRDFEWTPIGSSTTPFRGNVDGHDHTITNLVINSNDDYIGLFGYMSGGSLSNLRLNMVDISGSEHVGTFAGFLNSDAEGLKVSHVDLSGNRYVGGIAGYQTADISDCEVSYISIVCSRTDLSTPYSPTYMGNDAGGIAGMCNSDIEGCSISHLSVTGYRNVGGIAGNIQENTVTVTVSDCYITKSTIIADLDGGNAGVIVGRASDSTVMLSNSNLYTSIVYVTTPTDQGGETGGDPGSTPPNQLSGVYDKIIADDDGRVTYYKDGNPTVLNDMHQIILDGVTINAAENTPAITIESGAWLTIVIKNDVNLTGGKNADAIRVEAGASVTITGGGTLTVTGNNGQEYANKNGYNSGNSGYENTGGSGIGYAYNDTGSIKITNLANLYAYGYGVRAYGIGGDNSEVIITNSIVKAARGGFPGTEFLNGDYGNEEPEGSPAIGGSKVTIDSSIVESAIGGSKAAAIGARFWMSTEIVITNSSLQNIIGGNGSAGIGGSHPERVNAATVISIIIENSDVNATGGHYGAGIGSGYDRKCGSEGWMDLTIIITSYSDITATGGKYAADIGTGYHAGILKGRIDNTVTFHVSEGTDVKDGATYSHNAQGVGYGVVDYSREAASLMDGSEMVTPSFTVNGTPIINPFDPTRWSA